MDNRYQKAVYYWLMTGAILVLLMVVIGGITRLTESGLSMVKWEPIMGTIPPLNEADWQVEFDAYRASPEYQHYNSHFELEDFKKIYFWEYLHRLIGRFIGLVFLFPALFFWIKGAFSPKMKKKVVIIFLGGLFQGVLGWYMVKSGLVDKPHVSHYRLAAHLSTAFALVAYIYWVAMDWKQDRQFPHSKVRNWSIVLLIVLGIQIFYGAFVAGLKAGKMYNTFPKMGRDWIPSELSYAFDLHGIAAIVEGGGVVQLIHRYIAYLVFGIVLYMWVFVRKHHQALLESANWLLGLVSLQFLLGVFTLLLEVPISLGVLHQIVAALLLLAVVNILRKSNAGA